MRRMTYFVMALAMVLGLAQCKKEQPVTPQNEGVMITLNVGDNSNGSRANVEPDATSQVTFESGDEIYVAYNGEYVGYLVHNGSNFEGFVTITPVTPSQPLYFYYLGDNHRLDAADSEGKIRGCTATISDQHLYPHLPVISMGKSIDAEGRTVYYEEGMTSFSSRLYNKCSLMKFNVSTLSTADICITGMNNKVTVDFGKVNEHGDGLGSNPTNQGFSYSQDTDGGLIQMAGSSDAERWVIVLPQTELGEGDNGSAYSTDGIYSGKRPPIHAIESNKWYHEGEDIISLTLDQYSSDVVNLAGLTGTGECEVQSGQILIGTLGANVKISIADGATVTLDGVTINGTDDSSYNWAGITCLGDATIVLNGTNTVKGFYEYYPGIYVPESKTLTIQGTGTLNASSNGWACGIGGGLSISCGNIEIQGGTIRATGGAHAAGIGSGGGNLSTVRCGTITISGGNVTATGGSSAAGIGSGNGENNYYASCGDITISGGIVEATGGQYAAGIGSGYGSKASCGTITITDGVTSVTATKGSYATNSIGAGLSGTCGTVTIGGTVYSGGADANQPDGLTFVYPILVPTGAINGLFSVSSTKQVYFSQGNLLDNGNFEGNQDDYGDFFQWAESFTSNYSGDWRALTSDEWNYLFTDRTNASKLWGFAYVAYSNGIILLPDGSSLSINIEHSDWDNNSIDNTTWSEMEANGAVFLPAAGFMEGSSPEDTALKGYYWCSTSGWYMRFGDSDNSFEAPTCHAGGSDPRSVRLVLNAQ